MRGDGESGDTGALGGEKARRREWTEVTGFIIVCVLPFNKDIDVCTALGPLVHLVLMVSEERHTVCSLCKSTACLFSMHSTMT